MAPTTTTLHGDGAPTVGSGAGAEVWRSAAGAGYAPEWALFCDFTAATGQPTLPTSVSALSSFLAQVSGRPGTQARRVAAIVAAHRNAGHLLDRPHRRPDDAVALDARPAPEALIAACPTRGWPAGFLGRRDAYLVVLTTILGYTHARARSLPPDDLIIDPTSDVSDPHSRWLVAGRVVPITDDPRGCPTCALVRWLHILGIADGLGRGSARMHLAAATAPTALTPHEHTVAGPPRWRAATHLLPAIDRHGWIQDYQPLSTRSVSSRLALVASRACATTPPGTSADPDTSAHTRNQPGTRSPDDLEEVLAALDDVAAQADALNARIRALLTANPSDA